MSYILEALKKSDRERKQGKVPTLETEQERIELRSRRSRPLWPFILLGFLALGGVFIGAWFYWREPVPVPTPPQMAGAPDAPSRESSVPANATPVPEDLPPITGEPAPRSDQAPTAPVMTRNETVALTPEPATQVSTPTTDEETSEESDDGSAAPPGAESPEPETTPETAPGDEAEALSPPPNGKGETGVVKLENLPTEMQDELPEIKIGVHLYSANPGARRASINGRLLREGQLVGPGLRLEEITRQGAILSFRGRKFSVVVFSR